MAKQTTTARKTVTSQTLKRYLEEIAHIPPLDPDDEKSQARLIKKGDKKALRTLVEAWHHDMAALHQPQAVLVYRADRPVQHPVDPGPRGVHQRPRPDGPRRAAVGLQTGFPLALQPARAAALRGAR